jgi:hypothetical protein
MSRRDHIEAAAVIPASREALFGYLADLENHWALADRFVEVVELDRPEGPATGGTVRMRGPFGVTRTARTRVVAADEPNGMLGTARLGRSTLAVVSWTLIERPTGTLVLLRAELATAGVLDRLLLLAGGRAWLERRFVSTLARLGDLIRPVQVLDDEVAPQLQAA